MTKEQSILLIIKNEGHCFFIDCKECVFMKCFTNEFVLENKFGCSYSAKYRLKLIEHIKINILSELPE